MTEDMRLVDVRDHGARGDGKAIDSNAVNRAIASLGTAGGTIIFPSGRYLCFSIRLASNVSLLLSQGAVIEAADPARHGGHYDAPEDGCDGLYQDFGHSHWHNSLIWGVELDNVAIIGPGRIEGTGLTRHGPGAGWRKQTGERPLSMAQMDEAELRILEPQRDTMVGLGNKAIALRQCRRVTLKDFTILRGGHFAVLLSGVEDVAIDGLSIDTNRDGINLDCVRNASVTNCCVNTPNDDAIVIKSSLALGRPIASENVTVRDCLVSGFDIGTMLDGSFGRSQKVAPDRDRVTGRIKLGTESNGGFRNILISDCRFERSRGIALETVDGGTIEDVRISNIRMREVTTAPLFLRLGARCRGPEGTAPGQFRNIEMDGIEAVDIDHRFAATIAGISGNPIENVLLRNLHLVYRGGGTSKDAERSPEELADAYPEPSMFGITPAWALWIRHASKIVLENVRLETLAADARRKVVIEDSTDVISREPQSGALRRPTRS
jgi:polygalacturonase